MVGVEADDIISIPHDWAGSSTNLAKSTFSACVRFQRVETVGLLSPRSIWLTIDRRTPDISANASSERFFALRVSFSRVAMRIRMSCREFVGECLFDYR